MKILFVASEAVPFFATGGLADVAGSLPRVIRSRQQACRVVLPLYNTIKPEYRDKMEFVAEFAVPLAWRMQPCTVYRLTEGGVIHYFIESSYYFNRNRLYGEYDDAERFAFFSKAVLEMIQHIDFQPDIIHCNDWQTALVPTFLKIFYKNLEAYKNIKTVFTIHNVQFQGKYGMELCEDTLGIPAYAQGMVEYDSCCNFMKGAVENCDLVTTVSENYAVELMDPWFAHGMDRLLRQYRNKLSGVTNGIDTKRFNPAVDSKISAKFSERDMDGKAICRREMQKAMGIAADDRPIIAMVTRLTYQKGLDLVKYVFDDIMKLPVSFVLLASGDFDYERYFREAQNRYAGRVGVYIGFDPELSQRVYAGADIFLMPSVTEPCGLAQMIALRYGTTPIVRKTGGLSDTVMDVGDGGVGYTFQTYNAYDMLGAIERAVADFENKEGWAENQKRGMEMDFGWGNAANKYIELYEKLV